MSILNSIKNVRHHDIFLINKRILLNIHMHKHLIIFKVKSIQISLNISKPIIKLHLFHRLIDSLFIVKQSQKQNTNSS